MKVTKYNHELVIGNTYRQIAALTDEDGAAIDITGLTGVCQIKDEVNGTVIASPIVSIISASAGTLQWVLAAASTATIEPDSYVYHVTVTYASGDVETICNGQITAIMPEGI